jgi:hypothetical protein
VVVTFLSDGKSGLATFAARIDPERVGPDHSVSQEWLQHQQLHDQVRVHSERSGGLDVDGLNSMGAFKEFQPVSDGKVDFAIWDAYFALLKRQGVQGVAGALPDARAAGPDAEGARRDPSRRRRQDDGDEDQVLLLAESFDAMYRIRKTDGGAVSDKFAERLWDAGTRLAGYAAVGPVMGTVAPDGKTFYFAGYAGAPPQGQKVHPSWPNGRVCQMTVGGTIRQSADVPLPEKVDEGLAMAEGQRLDWYEAPWRIHMEGAVRAYPGLAPFSCSCACQTPRFDVDNYGQLYIPNALACSVQVVDSACNVILRFGAYGNRDSAGPGEDSPIKAPEIPLAYPAPKSPDSSGGLRWPCGVSDRL